MGLISGIHIGNYPILGLMAEKSDDLRGLIVELERGNSLQCWGSKATGPKVE